MLNYLIKIYSFAAKDAFTRLQGSWSVILGLLCLVLGFIVSGMIAANLGFLGGFLRSLYEAFAITYYLGWLRDSSQYRKVRLSDLKSLDWGLFQSVISVLFILFLVQWALSMLTTGMQATWTFSILQLLCVVLLNSLPETLYLTRKDGIDGIQESFNFTTKNWIEWYLPYLLIISPLLLVGMSLPDLLANTHIFFPAIAVITVPMTLFPSLSILAILLGIVLSHWFMLFRAKLYSELDQGSRRQRIFKSNSFQD